MQVKDKVCVVTGGASGIGEALARAYAQAGARGVVVADLKASRDRTFVTQDASGNTVNRCEGVAFAGGAAFSSEEGYFATKVMRSLGLVHLEQQARV